MVDSLGVGSLRPKSKNKKWSPEEKLVLVSKILAGYSYNSVALDNRINYRILYNWVQKYKEKGYNGLVDEKKGRPRKVPIMKENRSPRPLKESEREGLYTKSGAWKNSSPGFQFLGYISKSILSNHPRTVY